MCGFKIVLPDRPVFDSGEISCAVLAEQLEQRIYPRTHVPDHVPSPLTEIYSQLLKPPTYRPCHTYAILEKVNKWPSRPKKKMSLLK